MDHSQPRRIEERLLRHLLEWLALLGLALVQVTLLPHAFGFPLNPLLLVVVLLTLLNGLAVGARLAFIAGLGLDVVGATPLGSHALAMLLAATVVASLVVGFRPENPLLPVAAMLVGAICYELALALITRVVTAAAELRVYFTVVVLPSALLATIPALPLFVLLRRWANRHHVPALSGSRL
jgi:rod shape-determining protein MreD